MLHSRYFRTELINKAKAAHDRDGYVEGRDELEALARLSWPQAEPVLRMHAAGKAARVAALAMALLYAHYQDTDQEQAKECRQQLKAIVEDHQAPGRARDVASDALLSGKWEGQEEWYLSLFSDPTLRDLKDGFYLLSPLATPVHSDPDKWIPILADLVGSENRAVHDAAVSLLVSFQLQSARRDALLPLLPWLFDPKWSSARDRLRLIQSMNEIEILESITGLIAVLDQDSEYERSYAAESLAHYRDPRAVPALKRALEREKRWDHRRRIIQALIACGGLSTDDTVAAAEAYASQIQTRQGQEDVEQYTSDLLDKNPLPAEVAVGLYLSRSGPPNEETIQKLLARAKELESFHPAFAKSILEIVDQWPSRTADLNLIARIRNSDADGEAVHSALLKRESLNKTVGEDLDKLASTGGTGAGIAVVLLRDDARANEILGGEDTEAQTALLASARLVRKRLPVPAVARLLNSPNASLVRAAEAYLESEDSAYARELVLSRRPGQAAIIGARQEFDPGHNTYPVFDQWEGKLRDEVLKPNGPSEIFALLSAGYWGDAGQILVYVYEVGGKMVYYRGDKPSSTRTITVEELRRLRSFVSENKVEDLGPLAIAAWDGMQYEYVHVARAGGRRVFMNNPGTGPTGGSAYDRLCDHFRRLLVVRDTQKH